MEVAGKDFADASDYIDKHLATHPLARQGARPTVLLIGGTWRSVARLHMMETDYPLSVMHHYKMTMRQLERLYASVVSKEPER